MDKEIFIADKVYRTVKREQCIIIEPEVELYHGSPNEICIPTYGFGESKHDYGKGFYLTFDIELAKEWAVCNSDENGFVHKYLLETVGLNIIDFHTTYKNVLVWLAVLSKHRSGVNSKKDKLTEAKLIEQYYPAEIEKADVIIGYRADDSFFSFAKQAIRGEVDIKLLDEIMHTGKLGYQVFIQSSKAFSALKEVKAEGKNYYATVNQAEYSLKYNDRDHKARQYVADLIDSDRNTLKDTIEKYLEDSDGNI